jgi:hypothetical protein
MPFLEHGELVAFNVGFNDVVYLVIALHPLDYRTMQPGASFAKTIPEQPQTYRVIGLLESQVVLDVLIEGELFNIHHVQPLEDELLLVCGRSWYKNANDSEKNGRVYTLDGLFAREILLGDGIESVQTTSRGVIWTSYFDEGIFGNYGWNNPIGASGLVAWNAMGEKLYEFQASDGLDSICDCYALNVASDEDVWLYYYTEFPLVHLHRNQIKSVWNMPLRGSHAFAISGNHALFHVKYKDRHTFQLFSLEPQGKAKMITELEFIDENDNILSLQGIVGRTITFSSASATHNNTLSVESIQGIAGRADVIYFASNGFLYKIDVQTVLNG